MGRRSRDTRDTHGTHGRRKAHGSHRRTSQPRTIQTHQQHTSSARSATTEAGKPRYCTTSRVPPVSLEAGATYKHIFYMSSGSGLRVYFIEICIWARDGHPAWLERDRSNDRNAETVESQLPVRRKSSVRRIKLRRTMPCSRDTTLIHPPVAAKHSRPRHAAQVLHTELRWASSQSTSLR